MVRIHQTVKVKAGRSSTSNVPPTPTVTATASGTDTINWSITPFTGYVYQAVVSYQTQISSDAAFTSPTTSTATSGSVTGLAGSTTRYFRSRTYDGTTYSAWSSAANATTSAPAANVVMNAVWSNPSLWADRVQYVTSTPLTGTWNYTSYLIGTDTNTGQVFSATSPMLWGTQYTYPRLQQLSTNGILPSTYWTTQIAPAAREMLSGGIDGSPYVLGFARNNTFTSAKEQSAYQIRSETNWRNQGMVYCRLKLRLDPTWPTSGNYYVMLIEMKGNGASEGTPPDDKLSLTLVREPWPDGTNRWCLRLLAGTVAGGTTGVWTGAASRPGAIVPAEYPNPYGGSIYFAWGPMVASTGLSPPNFGNWWTIEMAWRFANATQVCGNTGQGWVWAATSEGSSEAPPANGSGTTRYYIPGQNALQPFKETGSSGTGVVFPFNAYYNGPAEGKTFEVGHSEVWTEWPSDASSHPAGAV